MKFHLALPVALALGAVACSKSSSEPASSPGGNAIDTIVADMTRYTEQTVPVLLAWNGDCAVHAKRLLALEPLALKIRAEQAAIEADPAGRTALESAMAAKKESVTASLEKTLAAAEMPLKDFIAREREIRIRCKGDPAFVDAVNRIGLATKH